MAAGSSGVGLSYASPPRTKTREPKDAMACPERPPGLGPMFWNMNHRLPARHVRICLSMSQLGCDLTRDLERSQIAEILPVNAAATENVHDIVYECRSMSLPRTWDVTNAR